MTEYWKSNAKKFCELCKCWFADNRVSIEHHEGGVRHKNAVQNKLRQLGQQSRTREEEDRNLRATLASMEVAALGSFKRDLKAQPSVAQQYNIHGSAMRVPIREAGCASGPSKDMQRSMGPTFTPSFGGTADYSGAASYESAPSHTASFDKVAVEMGRRVELAKRGKIPLANDPANFGQPSVSYSDRRREKNWVEAVSPEGDTYYWHIYSGDTTWDPPEAGYLLAEEYEAMQATQAALDEADEYTFGEDETVPAAPLNPAIKQPERIVPENIATLDDDERAEAEAAAEEDEAQSGEYLEERNEEEKPVKEEPKLTGCFVPGAVSYYTAPAVKPAPLPTFNPWGAAAVFDTAPSPDEEPPMTEEEPPMTDVKQSVFAPDSLPPGPLEELMRKRRAEKRRNAADKTVKEEEEEEEEEEELPEQKLKRLVQQDPAKPFGSWSVVKQEEKPEKVDLELPDASVRSAAEPVVTIAPEERLRFKEKTVASVSRKKGMNGADKGAPIEFKKRKTGARSLRSKDGDED
uniref:WW domain-binding protein 4 n=1 Tax=Plectus sambesii TaxID=2011161 RepID=A0A914WNJ0_9BILA